MKSRYKERERERQRDSVSRSLNLNENPAKGERKREYIHRGKSVQLSDSQFSIHPDPFPIFRFVLYSRCIDRSIRFVRVAERERERFDRDFAGANFPKREHDRTMMEWK